MCNNFSSEPHAQNATENENTEGDLYNMDSETEEFGGDEEHHPKRIVISDENAIVDPTAAVAACGADENSAHGSTTDGMKKESLNLINFSPDTSTIAESGNQEEPHNSAGIEVGNNIAEACGRIRISDVVQVVANVDVDIDPNVNEEGCGSSDANASYRSNDSDVILVMEYFYGTENELAEEHDIKRE